MQTADFLDVVILCQVFQQIHAEQFGRMSRQLQFRKYALDIVNLRRIALEKFYQQLRQFLFLQAFPAFFPCFSHKYVL